MTSRDTPAFDAARPGTAEERWLAGPLAQAPTVGLAGFDRVVVLAAHPDDETLGAGGLLAQAHRAGLPVEVVVATDGEASHPESPTTTPAELARRRRAEVRAAIDEVAPRARVTLLGLGDGRLAGRVDELAAALTGTLPVAPGGSRSGGRTLLVAPWTGDGHPDHSAAGLAAARAAADRSDVELWQYPIWWFHWAGPDDAAGADARRLPLSEPARAAKALALDRHVSQTAPLSPAAGDEALLAEEFVAHFRRPWETFFPAAPDQPDASLDVGFFDDFYAGRDDPWGFTDRWYEERKRAVTMAALPEPRFRSAFEPGCSIGVLTAELAGRCDAVLATDIAAAPLASARARLAGRPHVRFAQMTVPGQWPDGTFDLIVISEIGYYCDLADLARLVERSVAALTPDGVLLACHWRHPVAEYPLTGDAVHRAFRGHPGLRRWADYSEEHFRLDVFRRAADPTRTAVG